MIQGSTLFLGDSITVGLANLVRVDGAKGSLAEGGGTSGWLLSKAKALPDLSSYVNAFVLIGTNDVGGDAEPESIAVNVAELSLALARAGVRVFVATIPPFRGYAGYASRYDAIEAKRRKVNEELAQFGSRQGVYRVIPLDRLMSDPADPPRLTTSFDGGDHLHPRKDALARLLEQEMSTQAPNPLYPSKPSRIDGYALLTLASGLGLGYALVRRSSRI